MKLVPVYMTDLSVKKIMDSLPSDPTALQTPATGLKAVVAKRLSINSVYVVKPSHIKVKRSHGKNIVTIEYEPRGVLFGNLEYIVHFKHEAEIKGP